MAGTGHDENDEVGLVHHLNQVNTVTEQLNFLLNSVRRAVVLYYFKSLLGSNSEVLLGLVD